MRQQLAAVGRYVVTTPGRIPTPSSSASSSAGWPSTRARTRAAGFRAGWARLARFVGPRLRDWEARWFRAMRENDRLKSHIGGLLREISRLTDRA